ncbi:MAG: PQQ-binding-like beta-propeller repeat protein [Verrucomicrobia bacterium]|nr:PQQ-binding-like beta-propeller repeat protein [Verrucomicrobiota bacterium]
MKLCARLLPASMVVFLITSATADDWLQFRGPNGSGASTAKNLPLSWSATSNIVWKTTIPGRGRSSPVVLGDRIWVTTAVETNPRQYRESHDPVTGADRIGIGVVCLDRASGKILYHVTLYRVDNPPPAHQLNSFATPTPVADPGRLYCDFGAFGTACLDAATGKVLWQAKLPIDHHLAPGSSPAIWKNLLILVRDGRDQQFVAALEKRTGRQVWRTDRPPIEAKSPNMKKSFGTPAFVEVGGRAQVVIPCAHWFVSYDPATGKELWRVRHGTSFSIAPVPAVGNKLVYCCTGMTRQLWAIRPDGAGDVTASHVAWKADSVVGTMPSPLLVGDKLYGLSEAGAVSCLDAVTGADLGRRALVGSFSASPLLADGRIYVFNQKGKAYALKLGKDLEVLGESELEGPLFASPAAVGDKLYLRTDSTLYCIKKK